MVESAYAQGQAKPRVVRRWERLTSEAENASDATAQLVYEMLLQIRMIKLILAWVLVFIPAGAAVVLIVLTALAKSETPAYNPYGF
jgi:hypothetical protein